MNTLPLHYQTGTSSPPWSRGEKIGFTLKITGAVALGVWAWVNIANMLLSSGNPLWIDNKWLVFIMSALAFAFPEAACLFATAGEDHRRASFWQRLFLALGMAFGLAWLLLAAATYSRLGAPQEDIVAQMAKIGLESEAPRPWYGLPGFYLAATLVLTDLLIAAALCISATHSWWLHRTPPDLAAIRREAAELELEKRRLLDRLGHAEAFLKARRDTLAEQEARITAFYITSTNTLTA